METEPQESLKRIDIREMFKVKNPKLAKRIPGFVYNYINRILHIDEVNEIIAKYGHTYGAEFARSMVTDFNVQQTINGLENLPSSGRFIFASNHPLGGFDALLILSKIDEKFGEPITLVNDILMNIPQLRPVFIPLNKYGGNNKDVIRQLDELYSSDKQVLIFPCGFASRRKNGVIRDPEWKKHFIAKAIEYRRDIIPIHASGRNSNFFYNLANFRTFFHIKWNLETFFLPDEFFKQKNQHFTITFGEPIPYTHFDKSKTLDQWAAEVREIVYNLPNQYQTQDK